jgi:hypothetical protein
MDAGATTAARTFERRSFPGLTARQKDPTGMMGIQDCFAAPVRAHFCSSELAHPVAMAAAAWADSNGFDYTK